MKKFTNGDKIRCITPYGGVVKGNIYTFSRYKFDNDNDNPLIYLEELPIAYFESRFELVEISMDSLIKQGTEWVKNKTTLHDPKLGKFIPSSVGIYYTTNNPDCYAGKEIEKHGYSVCVMDGRAGYPVRDCVEVTNIVKNVGDFEAVVEKECIKINGVTIPWDKVEEIVKIHKNL
jgi:hypothetical protein